MAKYLWVNPVAAKMYGDNLAAIEKKLQDQGFVLVNCVPQLEYVKNQYKEVVNISQKTVLDCRCPESIHLLERYNLTSEFEVPMIEPILVRTSRVLYELYVKDETDELIITCPCTQLRDFTAKKLEDKKEVNCYTWKEFANQAGIESYGCIDASPIPLGFFDDAFGTVMKLSEKTEIVNGITNIKAGNSREYEIIELLYCKDGCNNGDGL